MKRAACDGAIVHAGELVVGLAPGSPPIGPGVTLERYRDGAVAWLDGEIVDAGPTDEVLSEWEPAEVDDAAGRLVTAGLVDAHTHLVWGGDRADEFALRLGGLSYEEVAKAGGGILSTAARDAGGRAPRRCSTAPAPPPFACWAAARRRSRPSPATRCRTRASSRCSTIGHRVAKATWLDVIGTALSAHVVPPEYSGRRDGVRRGRVRARRRRGAGPRPRRVRRLLRRAGRVHCRRTRGAWRPSPRARTWALRLHVDQLHDGGGALLAAELGAASADHLDHANEEGIAALARAGTVAVLLPGASLTLGGPVPPLAALRRHGVPTAIATDWNPGTSTDGLAGAHAGARLPPLQDDARGGVRRRDRGRRALAAPRRPHRLPAPRAPTPTS